MGVQLLKIRDVCRLLNVSRSTIYAMTKSGQLRPVRLGAAVRYRLGDIELLLAPSDADAERREGAA